MSNVFICILVTNTWMSERGLNPFAQACQSEYAVSHLSLHGLPRPICPNTDAFLGVWRRKEHAHLFLGRILENREHGNFENHFKGTRQSFLGNKGTWTPFPWESLSASGIYGNTSRTFIHLTLSTLGKILSRHTKYLFFLFSLDK